MVDTISDQKNIKNFKALNLHRAYECLDGKCDEIEVNDTIASWHHYRSGCAGQYLYGKYRDWVKIQIED